MTIVDPLPAAPPIRPPSPFRRGDVPALIRDIDLTADLPTIERDRPGAPPYVVAHLLVRIGPQPLGWVTVPFDGPVLGHKRLHAAMQHLAADAPEHEPLARTGHQVSIVITTCGLTDALLDTVRSALDNEHPVLEVIVVDNRPDGSRAPKALSDAFSRDKRVRYITESRRGLSNARNRGLHAAHGDLVAFTDDDVTIDRHWVGAFAAAFDSDPDIACVTGLILPRELETDAQVLIEEYGGYSKGFAPRVFDLRDNRVDSPLYPYAAGTFGSGANSAFRRSVLLELGGFDAHLGAGQPSRGGEDLDIQLRVVLGGHRLRYEPRAIVWHTHHRSMDSLRRQMHGYGVGLTAFIFKQMVTSRRARYDIARRVPAALRFHFRRDSGKNAHKQKDYPRSLAAIEFAGMAFGPVAYLRSRSLRRGRSG